MNCEATPTTAVQRNPDLLEGNVEVPASGWFYHGLIWPVETPYDHHRVAMQALGMGRSDALLRGFVRYRLHDDRRDWKGAEDFVAQTCSFNAFTVAPLSRLISYLIEVRRIPADMRLIVLDYLDRKQFDGRLGEFATWVDDRIRFHQGMVHERDQHPEMTPSHEFLLRWGVPKEKR